jgi:succinylarginine dihydrolase
MAERLIEVNFDGLVGPTHNFAGLSRGNVASSLSGGSVSRPKAAALEGLAKMRAVRALGARQAVLPPQPRPALGLLRSLGFSGSDAEVLESAARKAPRLVAIASSASSMWAANAATVAPATDTLDGRLHVVPANLSHMPHRSMEADCTHAVLARIFADEARFAVHAPLPPHEAFADEGAANHTRLTAGDGRVVHLFAWGRSSFDRSGAAPARFPARQTREASEAVARLLQLPEESVLFAQQHPEGIDRGAFHTDVLGVGNERMLLVHELAFADEAAVLAELRERLGSAFLVERASQAELPVEAAVASYPFNSQLLTLPDGSMAIVAPIEAREEPRARQFLESVLEADNPVARIEWLDVRQSMKNGGGPACLRQRIPLRESDLSALGARVLFDEELDRELVGWVEKHYRDELRPADLADPALLRESYEALDELTGILRLEGVYGFQRGAGMCDSPTP